MYETGHGIISREETHTSWGYRYGLYSSMHIIYGVSDTTAVRTAASYVLVPFYH